MKAKNEVKETTQNAAKNSAAKNSAVVRELSSFKPADQKDILAVRAVIAGDKEKYGRIIERYRPYLVQRYFLKVSDRDIAEDLASEALAHAYTRLEKYRECFTFNAWFTRVADNFLVDWSRKSECRLKMVSTSYDKLMSTDDGSETSFLDALALADPDVTADSKFLDAERLKVIHEGLSNIDKLGRRLIEMFYGEEMMYEDMAAEVGINTNTMKIALMRAKHQLADYIRKEYPEFEVRSLSTKRFSSAKKTTVLIEGQEHPVYAV